MSTLRKEQITRIFTGTVLTSAVSINGTSVNITTPLTAALLTAGFGGGAVALTNSSSEAVAGLIISGAYNRCEVYQTSTNKPIFYNGEKVYGRLTYSVGVYTLSLYYKNGGVETAYNTGGAVSCDLLSPYRFMFKDIPSDVFIKPKQLYPYNETNSAATQGRIFTEELTVSATNVISNLTYVPTPSTKVILYVNGKAESNAGGTPSFTVAGNIITWIPLNAEYDVLTTFKVTAEYLTLQ